ncbi:MAG: hypothetical protein WC444_07650 [Candidatus Paceibacterota bacterium]
MPTKHLTIRKCEECPYCSDYADICELNKLRVGPLMSPPPLCPIDELNKERSGTPNLRYIQCVTCRRIESSYKSTPFTGWTIIEDNHGNVVIDYPDKTWNWIGICPDIHMHRKISMIHYVPSMHVSLTYLMSMNTWIHMIY